MKSLKIIISLILVFALIVSCFAAPAEAAVMTATMLGAGLIAVAAGAGAIYASKTQSQASLTQWAQDRIDSWLDGRSIAEAFGAEYIRMAHGKLIIPAVIYNAINDMINEDVTESGVEPGEEGKVIGSGMYYDKVINQTPYQSSGLYDPGLIGVSYGYVSEPSISGVSVIFVKSSGTFIVYVDGTEVARDVGRFGSEVSVDSVTDYCFIRHNVTDESFLMCYRGYSNVFHQEYYYPGVRIHLTAAEKDINLSLDQPWEKDICDVGYQWEGSISGSEADTNIDDLIDTIFKEAAQDTITVEGTIEGETPYPPQPTTYPIDDILGGMDTINESINERGEDVTDAIGSVVDGIHSQTGAINDAASAVSDKVQSLEDTLVESLDVPTTAEASGFKWDLSQLFPFCIPFDIAAMYQAFDGVAAAPNIQIPIVIPSIGFSYTMQLDFSPFNSVAAILRQVELIAFGLALAWGTSKVIRW